MNSGFVKQYRKELCSDIWKMSPIYNRVWRWLLLNAKWKKGIFPTPKKFGIHLNPGQLLTSYEIIAKGVSWLEYGKEKTPNRKTIKTILDWLKDNDMILLESNAKGTFICIVKWDKYNTPDDEKVTENGQRSGHHMDSAPDTIKEVKRITKEVKKKNTHDGFEARKYLSERGVINQHITDFLKSRKRKRLEPTKTAFDRIGIEFEKVGLDWPTGIKKCCEESWGSFKASWLNGKNNQPKIGTIHQAKIVEDDGIAKALLEKERRESEQEHSKGKPLPLIDKV